MTVATLEDRVEWLEDRVNELLELRPRSSRKRPCASRTLFTLVAEPGPGVQHSSIKGRKFTLVRALTRKQCEMLQLDDAYRYWNYRFSDGWSVTIKGRLLKHGERAPKSNGFLGYEWMIDSIIDKDKIESTRTSKEVDDGNDQR